VSTTTGIKLDPSTKQRIKQAAASLDRTPHWFMKKAVLYWLDRVEEGSGVSDILTETDMDADDRLNSVHSRQQLLSVD
jgi:predicted transcriptional regulator